jgi:hypothetical protein
MIAHVETTVVRQPLSVFLSSAAKCLPPGLTHPYCVNTPKILRFYPGPAPPRTLLVAAAARNRPEMQVRAAPAAGLSVSSKLPKYPLRY